MTLGRDDSTINIVMAIIIIIILWRPLAGADYYRSDWNLQCISETGIRDRQTDRQRPLVNSGETLSIRCTVAYYYYY